MDTQVDALALLELAIEIGHEELRALQKGEVEEAEAHCTRRDELLDQALELKDTADQRQFRKRLQAYVALQDQLTAEGQEQRALLLAAIHRNKQEGRRHKAYGQIIKQGM